MLFFLYNFFIQVSTLNRWSSFLAVVIYINRNVFIFYDDSITQHVLETHPYCSSIIFIMLYQSFVYSIWIIWPFYFWWSFELFQVWKYYWKCSYDYFIHVSWGNAHTFFWVEILENANIFSKYYKIFQFILS